MNNNDILNRICNTFDLNDSAVIEIFSLAGLNITKEQVSAWLANEDKETFISLSGAELTRFLNGFINLKRGKRDGGQPKLEDNLSNNMIFQKLRIALNLKAEDILDIFQLVDIYFSKNELGAFFRKPNNKHYRECKDETLQNFLLGVQSQLRPDDSL